MGHMAEVSEFLLVLFVLLPIAIFVVYLLSLGPSGWFLVGFFAIAVMAVQALRASPADRTPDRRVCPTCGSPNSPTASECGYCSNPLGEPRAD